MSQPVNIEVLAGKLADAENDFGSYLVQQFAREPRLREVLFYIQWRSFQPGGLMALAQDLLRDFPERVRTRTMAASTAGPGGRFAFAACIRILDEFPLWGEPYGSKDLSQAADVLLCSLRGRRPNDGEVRQAEREQRAVADEIRAKLTDEWLTQHVRKIASERLPAFLFELCTSKGLAFPDHEVDWPGAAASRLCWYFQGLTEALVLHIEAHARRTIAGLALTSITARILDEIESSRECKELLVVAGDSSWGKSETVEAAAKAWPGRCRLLTAPAGDGLNTLVECAAKALGMNFRPGASPSQLGRRIEDVVARCGLQILVDEGHFLVPQGLTRNTQPKRLNWFRQAVVDKHVACVLFVTPQDYKTWFDNFVRVTGWNALQWRSRAPMIRLPDPTLEDIQIVVEFYLPELTTQDREKLKRRAQHADGFLRAVKRVALKAAHLAGKSGKPAKEHYPAAIAYVFPKVFDQAGLGSDAADALRDHSSSPPKTFSPARKGVGTETVRTDHTPDRTGLRAGPVLTDADSGGRGAVGAARVCAGRVRGSLDREAGAPADAAIPEHDPQGLAPLPDQA